MHAKKSSSARKNVLVQSYSRDGPYGTKHAPFEHFTFTYYRYYTVQRILNREHNILSKTSNVKQSLLQKVNE